MKVLPNFGRSLRMVVSSDIERTVVIKDGMDVFIRETRIGLMDGAIVVGKKQSFGERHFGVAEERRIF